MTLAADRILRLEKQDYEVDEKKTGIFNWKDAKLRRNGSIFVEGKTLTFVMTGMEGCYLDDVMAVLRDLYRHFLKSKLSKNPFSTLFGTKDYVSLSDGKCPLLFTFGNIISFTMDDDCSIGDILLAIRNTYLSYQDPDKYTLSVISKLEKGLSWCNMGCLMESDSDDSKRFVSKIIDILQGSVEEMDFRSWNKHKYAYDKEEADYIPEYFNNLPWGPK